MALPVLRSTDRVLCRMSPNSALSALFSQDYIGVVGFLENYRTRGIITLPQGFMVSPWFLTGSANFCHLLAGTLR